MPGRDDMLRRFRQSSSIGILVAKGRVNASKTTHQEAGALFHAAQDLGRRGRGSGRDGEGAGNPIKSPLRSPPLCLAVGEELSLGAAKDGTAQIAARLSGEKGMGGWTHGLGGSPRLPHAKGAPAHTS